MARLRQQAVKRVSAGLRVGKEAGKTKGRRRRHLGVGKKEKGEGRWLIKWRS